MGAPKMLAQVFRIESLPHQSPYSMEVAASRLSCAEPTEHRSLYATRLWKLEDDINPRASLYDLALRLHARSTEIPRELLPELSVLIDGALACCAWIDLDPRRNVVATIYAEGAYSFAPLPRPSH